MSYIVRLMQPAKQDIERIIDFIENEMQAPLSAERFSQGIYAKIADLEKNARIYAISTYKNILEFGKNARHINYKGFTIIYTIHYDLVLIHRIIHGSFIKE